MILFIFELTLYQTFKDKWCCLFSLGSVGMVPLSIAIAFTFAFAWSCPPSFVSHVNPPIYFFCLFSNHPSICLVCLRANMHVLAITSMAPSRVFPSWRPGSFCFLLKLARQQNLVTDAKQTRDETERKKERERSKVGPKSTHIVRGVSSF